MTRANTWSGALAAVIAVGAGCDDKAETSTEVRLGQFGARASQSICDKVYECCGANDSELAAHMNYSGGRAACGTKTEGAMGFWAAIIEQEQAKGRLSYDPTLARRCLDSFGAASCDAHKRNEPLAGCDSFITPKTSPGMPCQAGESCIGGTCVGQGENVEGVCQAFAGAGQSCAEAPCAKDLFCEGGSKTCRARRSNGESCHTHGECASQGCNGRNPDAGTPGSCGLKGGASPCFVTTGCSYGGAPAGGGGLALALGLLALGWARRRRGEAKGVSAQL